MLKTTEITFICRITGYDKYWLEQNDITLEYWFCRELSNLTYNQYNITDFINSVYTLDRSRATNVKLDPLDPTNYIVCIPVEKDPVVMSDFLAHEDKQLPLPFGSLQTGNGIYTLPVSGAWQTYSPKDFGFKDETRTEAGTCNHEPYTYIGLNHTDTYCKKCEVKL